MSALGQLLLSALEGTFVWEISIPTEPGRTEVLRIEREQGVKTGTRIKEMGTP